MKLYSFRLRQARGSRGWSQKEVAEKIGSLPNTVSRWERGITYPDVYLRQRLMDLFPELNPFPPFEEEVPEQGLGPGEETAKPSDVPAGERSVESENHADLSTIRAIRTPLQKQNRKHMLERLHRSYNDLMDQSLQGVAWFELGLTSRPDAVQNATRLLLRTSDLTEHPLPPGTSIEEVYDKAGHELLILGEPGAGKSTLLLRLAQQLVTRAEQDETHPLPVILPLSSWAVKRPKLADWIAEQLAQIYDIPRHLSVEWAEEGGILPLLDGLDEMEETALAECIEAINTYHRDCLAWLVVCSRTTEYNAGALRQHLFLQGAVIVQPLTREDVDAYLVRAGKPLTALRCALKEKSALYDFAIIPLMLNILILTYKDLLMQDLPDRQSLLQKSVWDDYIKRMVERKGNSERYPRGQTRKWLSYLARQMRSHNQTVFYLEYLQPDWLAAKQRGIYTWFAVCLPAVLIGVLVSILVFLFFFGSNSAADLTTYLEFGTLGGFLGSLWYEPTAEVKQEHRQMWGRLLLKRLGISVCIGLITGGSLWFHLYFHLHYDWSHALTSILLSGGVIGLSTLLLQYLPRTLFHRSISVGNSTRWLWQQIIRFLQMVQGLRAFLVAVILGLTCAVTVGPYYRPPMIWARVGLSFGVIYALIHAALSLHMEDVRPSEHLRWSWRGLRRGFFSARHLLITALLIAIIVIFVLLEQWLSTSLHYLLTIGLSYWFLLGLSQSMTQERIEDEDRRVTNQGIHRSLRNSVMLGMVGGGIIGGIGLPGYWLQTSQIPTLVNSGLNYALLVGICGALLIFLLTGGLAVLRHMVIRLLFWRSRTFPIHATQFLDDATARFFLRRVGGGYSFVHRLLLDHLAE